MKKIIFTLLVISTFLSFNNGIGQWEQVAHNIRTGSFPWSNVSAVTSMGNYVFAGTNEYGIKISTNNGMKWQQSMYLWATATAMAIKGEYIFCSFERNNGVYYSTNLGLNWAQTGLNNQTVISLNVIGAKIYAGTESNGLFVTTNNGFSWTQVAFPGNSVSSVCEFQNILFAGVNGSSFNIYKSTNNGITWSITSYNGHGINSLVSCNDNIIAGTSYTGIYLSSNAGLNWIQLGVAEGEHILSMAVNGSNIVAGTMYGGIYLSTNSGLNWTKTIINNLEIRSVAYNGDYIYGASQYKGFYISSNNGGSWYTPPSDVNTFILSNNELYSGAKYGLFHSSNYGIDWISKNINYKNVKAICKYDNYTFIGTQDSGIYYSTNNGANWTHTLLNNKTINSLININSRIVAGTLNNGIYYSDDNGINWNQSSINDYSVNAIHENGNILYAGTNLAGVHISTNFGTNWSQSALNFFNVNSFTSVGNWVFSGVDNQGVYVTTNFGTNWIQTNLNNKSIKSLANYGKTLFAGATQGGVYYSNNMGNTWAILNDGIDNQNVKALISSGRFIYAGTDSSGIYRRYIQPEVPALVIPLNNSFSIPLNINLAWKNMQFASEYNVVLASDANFSSILIDTVTTDTTKSIYGLQNNTSYYWKVRGKSGTIWDDFSAASKFTTSARRFYVATTGNDSAAGTINDPFRTIQKGINFSESGDTVIVLPGVYNGNININKNISLVSNYFFSNDTSDISNTILDGTEFISNSAFIEIQTNLQYLIEGFTIQNVLKTALYSNLPLKGIIKNNILRYCGRNDIVCFLTGNIVFSNCLLYNNLGNFLILIGNDGVIVENCVFKNNGAYGVGSSGLIFSEHKCKIINNLMYNNYPPPIAVGGNGGLDTVIIANNTIVGNKSYGIFFHNFAGGTINFVLNNIIEDNTDNIRWYPGGFSIVEFRNNIITPFTQSYFPDIFNYKITKYNNDTINMSGIIHPVFNDNDLMINDFSPGIGTGTIAGAPLTDFSGNPRPNPAGSNPDMGAFENARAHHRLLTPVLNSPVSGSLNNPISFNLKWTKTYDATHYRLQLSGDDQFQTAIILDTIITDTTRFAGNLLHDTTYYWRVQSMYPYDTSAWSATWNFKTIVDTPDVAALSLPVNNSANISISPLLVWNKTPRTEKYTLEVSTDSAFATFIFRDTTLTDTLKQIGPLNNFTKYYWRINSRNIGGTSQWSEVWSFKTTLAAAGLISPARNSTGNSLSPNFQWEQINGATKYHLVLAKDSVFTQVVYSDTNITAIEKTIDNLDLLTHYYWKVKAGNDDGYGDFSETWSFKTKGTPALVAAVYPGSNSQHIPVDLTFKWSKVAEQTLKSKNKGASGKESSGTTFYYWFELSTDSLFSTLITSDTTLTDTVKSVNGLSNLTNYYWRLKAKNEGGWGEYNQFSRFETVIDTPDAASLSLPMNNTGNMSVSPVFSWFKAERAANYTLEISADSTFATVAFRDTTLTDTTKQAAGLSNFTKYYWRVNARNIGGTGQWSEIRSFMTTVANPVLVSPLNNSTGNLPNPKLQWSAVTGAAFYNLIIAKDSLFEQTVLNDSGLTGTEKTVDNLEKLTFYYWKVRAGNEAGFGLFSNVWSFKTKGNPIMVSTIYPGNNSTDIPLNIIFQWSKSSEQTFKSGIKNEDGSLQKSISNYWFELVNDTSTMAGLTNDSTITDTTKSGIGLLNSTNYWWRVRAKNEFGWGDFTAWSKFRTVKPTRYYISINGDDNAIGTEAYPLRTIQKGIDLSINHDTVIMMSGRYLENIDFKTKSIVLASNFIFNKDSSLIQSTILDGNQTGSCIKMFEPLDTTTMLIGFTITNGFALEGGGICARNGYGVNATFNNVRIYGNKANAGGAIHGMRTAFTFNNCLIDSNISLSYAGAIYIGQVGVKVRLNNCSIINNRAAGSGAAAYFFEVEPTFNSVLIKNNYSGGGAIIGRINGAMKMYNSLIINNITSSKILEQQGGVDEIINTSIINNNTNGYNTIQLHYGANVYYKNCVISNTSPYELAMSNISPVVLKVSHSLIPRGKSSVFIDYQNGFSTLNWDSNTIISRPLELIDNAEGDFRLSDYSPGIGTGTIAGAPLTDFSGNPRPSPAGSNPDIGAFENARAHFKLLTPNLYSPISGNINLPINNDFKWSSIFGATHYRLQISNDNQFTAGLTLDTMVTDTTRFVSNLLHDTTYYWRVQSLYPYDTSAWSATWNFKTIVDTPDVAVLSLPVNNSANINISPLLVWNKTPRAEKYTLEVSTDSTFATLIVRDTTLTDTLKQIGPLNNFTKYYWRVNARNIGGTGPWSERWNFTTTVSNASLISPLNNSIGNLVSPTLQWNQTTGATKYHLQVAHDSLFSQIAFNDSSIAEMQKTVENLDPLSYYFWRVRAGNNDGYGNYSEIWSFKTKGTPALVSAVYPANNSIYIPVNLTLKWSKAAEQTLKSRSSGKVSGKDAPDAILRYGFELATDSLFSNIVTADTTLTDTVKTVTGLTNFTYYYWRLKAKNETGWGEFNTASKFQTIIDTPDVVSKSLPLNNAVNLSTSPTFSWIKAERATNYTLEISADSNFINVAFRDTTITDTLKQAAGLNNYTKYYWRVNARNTGGTGPWSEKWSFTTTIANPVLASPLNNSVGNLPSPTLQWNSVTGATHYNLLVSKDSLFNQIVFSDSNIVNTDTTIYNLEYLTIYYWKVGAGNSSGYGNFSGYWNFKTKGAPVAVTTVYPENNSFNIPIDLTFKWQKGIDQTLQLPNLKPVIQTAINKTGRNGLSEQKEVIGNYWFEMATDTVTFAGLVRDTTLADTTKALSGLANYAYYFWRVRAKNEAGWGLFSAWSRFRTIIQAPSTITLLQPANGSTGQNLITTLIWRKDSISTKYFLQVANDSLFSSIFLSDSTNTGNDTVKTISSLQYNKRYFWRVRGYNVGGLGAYSNTWNFFTITTSAVQLSAPANGSVNHPLSLNLFWNAEQTAVRYNLQVSTDTNFTSFILNDSSITATSKQISGLAVNTAYYWRVRAISNTGIGPFSSRWLFVTQLPVPNIPTIGAGNGTITLNWTISPSTNIRIFRIYRNTSSPAATLIDSVPGTQFTFSNTGLINGTTYYYRIKAVNFFNGESDYSNERSAMPFNIGPTAAQLRDTTLFNEGRVLLRNLTFSSTGSTDPDGAIDSTKWYINDIYVGNSANYTYNFPQGLTRVKLIVVDNNGAKDSSKANVRRAVFGKQFQGQVYAGLSMTGDSVLYAIASGDKVYRMDINGNIKYGLNVNGNILSSSSISSDTSVFIGSTDFNLYAFSKNGTSLWPALALGGQLTATATVDSLTNRLFIGTSNNNFQAINKATGQVVWNFFADGAIRHSAVITASRKLVFTTSTGTIYGFNADNLTTDPIWTVFANNDTINTSPAIDNQGYFYVGTTTGKLKKILMLPGNPGTVVWESTLGGRITSSPVIDAEGKIYVGSSNGNLYRLKASNGAIESIFSSGYAINTTPALSRSGIIYFGNQGGEVYGIDTSRAIRLYYKDTTAIGTAILYKTGTIYIGTAGGKVLAFYDGTPEIGDNPESTLPAPMWGTYQGNNRRTGSQIDVSVGIFSPVTEIPKEYFVSNNYPNPFNPATRIKYGIPAESDVRMVIYDMLGREVKVLVNEKQKAGTYEVTFNASFLPSGVYFYRIVAKDFVQTKRMVLLK